jgi:uncharacterized membrane protein required for colicin V production
MKFHWLDLIVAIFILRGVIIGYRRGLSGELLRFLGILCALGLSFKFYEAGADRLLQHVSMERNIALGCSFTGIFLAVLIFFYMLNRTVHQMMEIPGIAFLEHGGGAILGGAKSLLFAFLALILLALVRVDRIANAVTQDSFFGPLAISAVPGAYKFASRVYPSVQSLPAEEVMQKLPGVRERTEFDFFGAAQKTPERGEGTSGASQEPASPPAKRGTNR